MGTWLEFRCENRSDPTADGEGPDDRCYSHTNSGPMAMATDTKAGVMDTLDFMSDEALAKGWLKSASGWYCPYCVKALGMKPRKSRN